MVSMALAHRWFVGIDLHKETLTVCIYCPCCGEIRFQKLVCTCRKQIAEFFGSLPRPHVVAIETVGFYRWLWEMLEPLVDKLRQLDAATKARRYICEGRLSIGSVNGSVTATAKGDGAIYHLGWERGRWFCDCPCMTDQCSHLKALRLVVVR